MRPIKTLTNTQFTTLSEHIMSKQVIFSMLDQGNTGNEILSILDVIVSDIEQEGIDSCAEVFAVNWSLHSKHQWPYGLGGHKIYPTDHTLTNTLLLYYVQDRDAFDACSR